MLIVLSPAKTLNFDPQNLTVHLTEPVFLRDTEKLIRGLRSKTVTDFRELMSISDNLARLNYERYQNWDRPEVPEKAAILAFDGDVYDGLNAGSMTEEQLLYAQQRLRILSGLYGVLKPLDRIKPHRLEMGTNLETGRHKNLYSFWTDKIFREINKTISSGEDNLLVNLASQEYFKSIDKRRLKMKIVTPEFRDFSQGTYRIVSFFAKRARGLMTRFILDNRIAKTEDLKAFDSDGYHFAPSMSNGNKLIFIRDH
jgi:uncharacterized protein